MLIYVIRLTSWCSWGVLYPFLAVWLIRSGTLDEVVIGAIVGVAVVANRVGGLLFAPLVAYLDKRTAIVASQAVVAAVAVALYLVHSADTGAATPWLVAAALFGMANSVATLAQITFIADQFPPEQTTRAFSYENVALNIGAGLGPVLSSVVITWLPGGYALAPIPFAVVTGLLAARLPRDARRAAPRSVSRTGPAGPVRRVLPVFLTMNFFTLLAYAQFYSVFPVYAEPLLGAQLVGLLFAFSSVVIVLGQVLLTRFAARLGERGQLAAANLVTAVGTALLLQAGAGIGYVLVAVALLTLGEMLYAPLYQAIAARMIPGRPTYAMGSVIFVWGVSESVASVAGLALIGAGLGRISFLAGGAACLVAGAIALVAPGITGRQRPGGRGEPAGASPVTALADGPVGGRSVAARRPLSR